VTLSANTRTWFGNAARAPAKFGREETLRVATIGACHSVALPGHAETRWPAVVTVVSHRETAAPGPLLQALPLPRLLAVVQGPPLAASFR
jgi:hypothetical protein